MFLNVIIISAGLISSILLFYRFPMLKKTDAANRISKISVVIPARNEEMNLSLLLKDLKEQTYPIHEIICVDDCSTDATGSVVLGFGANLVTITDKPPDWTGKAWACQKGSETASGELLLFLDADVRLSPDALYTLMSAYHENQCVISVQPYHHMEKNYEQFSLIFNLIQIGANGTSTVFKCPNAGLYGPVILINKEEYLLIEGHLSAKSSIVDDLALGEKLTKTGLPYKLFLGGQDISFRMYGSGFSDLIRGWTKNFATGAIKSPPLLFVLVFLWVTSCTSVILCFFQSLFLQDFPACIMFSFLYVLWVLELFRIVAKIGNFKKIVLICFPVYMALFLGVFTLSFIKKLFHLNVIWKDRKIRLEK